MLRRCLLTLTGACLLSACAVRAADPVLLTASGLVLKANPNVVIVRPRLPDSRFGTALALKVRGTTRAATLTTRKHGAQVIPVQQDTAPGDLKPNQPVAVIYAQTAEESVLLSAVAGPPP